MEEDDQKLRVRFVGRNGRRRYDPVSKDASSPPTASSPWRLVTKRRCSAWREADNRPVLVRSIIPVEMIPLAFAGRA